VWPCDYWNWLKRHRSRLQRHFRSIRQVAAQSICPCQIFIGERNVDLSQPVWCRWTNKAVCSRPTNVYQPWHFEPSAQDPLFPAGLQNPLGAFLLCLRSGIGWPLCTFTNYIYLLTCLLSIDERLNDCWTDWNSKPDVLLTYFSPPNVNQPWHFESSADHSARLQIILTHSLTTGLIKFFGDNSIDGILALCLCTTAEPSGPVWTPYRGTGTADQAELVKLGPAQLNLISLHSTLVWQLPIIEHKVDRHGGRSWKPQRPLDKHQWWCDGLLTEELWRCLRPVSRLAVDRESVVWSDEPPLCSSSELPTSSSPVPTVVRPPDPVSAAAAMLPVPSIMSSTSPLNRARAASASCISPAHYYYYYYYYFFGPSAHRSRHENWKLSKIITTACYSMSKMSSGRRSHSPFGAL